MAIRYKVYYSPCLPLYTYKMEESGITVNMAEYYVGKHYGPQTVDVVWNDDIKALCRFLDKKLLRYMGKRIYKIDNIETVSEPGIRYVSAGDGDFDYHSFARSAYTAYNSTITSATDRYNYFYSTAVNSTRR